MFTPEVLHEIFLRRDLENKYRMEEIENSLLKLQTQIELIIKLLKVNPA